MVDFLQVEYDSQDQQHQKKCWLIWKPLGGHHHCHHPLHNHCHSWKLEENHCLPLRVNATPKKMLLNLETQRKSLRLSAYKGETPRRITYPQTERRAAYYVSTPSGPNSTSTQISLLYEDVTPSVCDESQWDGTCVNSFNVLDWNEKERDLFVVVFFKS